MPRPNFVLIDFENVQPKDIELLEGGPYKVKVFLGATQTKIPTELARSLQPFGGDAEYIQIDGNGSNALDFHIAFYIGKLAAQIPDAFFHIVSKDTGFDPLIKHLKSKNIFCARSAKISDIPLIKSFQNSKPSARPVKSEQQPVQKVLKPTEKSKVDSIIEKLVSQKASKPRTLKTLGSTIKAHFANQIADNDLHHLIKILTQRGIVKVLDGKVTYRLPS
jgi:hypothetical protein